MEYIDIWPAYIRKWVVRVQIWGGWWQKLKQKAKMTRDYSSYDVHAYSQRVNIPLQGLDRCVLTVREVSGPHCQICIPPLELFH